MPSSSTCTGWTPGSTRSSRRASSSRRSPAQLASERTRRARPDRVAALRRQRPGRARARSAGAARPGGCDQPQCRPRALRRRASTGSPSCIRPTGERLGSGVEKESVHAHAMIAEAVMAGDGGLARNRMRKHLQAEAEFFRRRRSTRQLLPDSVVLAESAQRQGRRDGGPPHHPGHRRRGPAAGRAGRHRARADRARGRRAERCCARPCGCSSTTTSPACDAGPGGGLFVIAPSADAVTEIAAIYLARRGMQLGDLAEMRTGVEVAIAELAAERIDDAGAWPAARGADPGGVRHGRRAGRGGARPARRCRGGGP